METVWYVLIALMLTAYAVLDGFDLGAGAIHLLLARTDDERRTVLRSVGPVWDGNEVWLLAGGGTLYYAFPLLYASSFSGFYLPLHMVLWLLMLRAVGIEFRAHLELPIWRQFFDGAFFFGSTLLIVFFGAALGNVIRGVPLHEDHFFFEPLWTDWRVGVNNGILDWYTVLCAVLAVAALAAHGASYLALKTEGDLQQRADRAAELSLGPLVLLTLVSLVATLKIRPQLLQNYDRHPAGFVIPLGVLLGLMGMIYFSVRRNDWRRFLFSCLYIVAMLVGAAYALYPNLLPASTGEGYSLTVYNSRAGDYSLSLGLYWWGVGMALALAYFVVVYTMFRGKVSHETAGHY